MDEVAAIFQGDDEPYIAWLGEHPNGLVLNTPRGFPSREMVLHRATCPCISVTQAGVPLGAFTERDYVKVCGSSVAVLRRWLEGHGRTRRLVHEYRLHLSAAGRRRASRRCRERSERSPRLGSRQRGGGRRRIAAP